MLQPRNTLVLVRLITKAERIRGEIIVPTNNEAYTEAEIIAVGPGNVSAEGGRTETFDLKKGQIVWVKHKDRKPIGGGASQLIDATLPFTIGDLTYNMLEQSSVLAILAEPVETPAAASVDASTQPDSTDATHVVGGCVLCRGEDEPTPGYAGRDETGGQDAVA